MLTLDDSRVLFLEFSIFSEPRRELTKLVTFTSAHEPNCWWATRVLLDHYIAGFENRVPPTSIRNYCDSSISDLGPIVRGRLRHFAFSMVFAISRGGKHHFSCSRFICRRVYFFHIETHK